MEKGRFHQLLLLKRFIFNNSQLFLFKLKAELHVVSTDYKAENADELTIKQAEFLEVISKSITGFWKVKYLK